MIPRGKGAVSMQQILSIQALTLLAGLALIVIGSFGGGIEVKEIKIPTLPTFSRALSLAFGIVLLVLGIGFPQLFPTPPIAASSSTQLASVARVEEKAKSPEEKPKVWLGAAVENHVITISDVKRILRHLGKYSGPINDDVDDAYQKAVAEFQLSQNLKTDTYVGPDTYRKLREAWPDFFEIRNPEK
jgi:Putative peptidoglycan binding domain